jgi:hypothetical protein
MRKRGEFLSVEVTNNFDEGESKYPYYKDIECGLWIEMKVGKNKPTQEQEWWFEKLQENGYRVKVCYSAGEAIDEILDYLS